MKRLVGLAMLAALFAGSGAALAQQSTTDRVKQGTKNAAHGTKEAAKTTGKTVKKGSKKAVHAGANTTRKGAGAVEGKTETK